MFSSSDIPLKLRDNTLHVGVAWYAFCILLRVCIGLGMIIYNSWLLEHGRWILWVIIGLMVFTAFGFLRKYYTVNPVWKVYMRYIIMAICVVCLVSIGIWKKRDDLIAIAGIFIIIDVLMGVMSRYITMNMVYV
jgi:hypothetical protein